MKAFIAILFSSLILLPSAVAGGLKDNGLSETCRIEIDASRVLTLPVKAVPGAASLIVNGVKHAVHAVASFGADVPRHASHAPRMAVHASNKGAASAKAKASEGMMGFTTFSSFLLRIASSSFWALVSGILRF
jgi:hypothetical protein